MKLTENLQIIQVSLGNRSYPIVIGTGILSSPQILQKYVPYQQVALVSNQTVAPFYLESLLSYFFDRDIIKIILPDGEQYKNWSTLNIIFDELMQQKFDRSAALCSLGGGVIGDMVGFAAACYRRGIDFIQIPTTLLAQVDAAIGGKTGINHPLGKNMIGAFYQPKAVLIDVDTLRTLPEREYRAGLAEVVKYGLIKDAEFFDWVVTNRAKILAREPETLIHIIKRSCQIKANIVASDELERGDRALLNFGHTFGHALEAATKYKVWLHGEAVAIGMAAASFMSYQLGHLDEMNYQKIIDALIAFGLPVTQNQTITAKILKNYLLQDKKILAGQLRLVLLSAIGSAAIVSHFPESVLDKALLKM